MEGLYVDIRSLLDETTQERYHERIGGEYMGKSGVINQDFKGEDNTAYHDVIRLFKIYRSVNWRMQIKVNQVKHRVQEEYGTNLDEFLDHIYQAGIEHRRDEEEAYSEDRIDCDFEKIEEVAVDTFTLFDGDIQEFLDGREDTEEILTVKQENTGKM